MFVDNRFCLAAGEGGTLSIRACTQVPSLPLLLVCGRLAVTEDTGFDMDIGGYAAVPEVLENEVNSEVVKGSGTEEPVDYKMIVDGCECPAMKARLMSVCMLILASRSQLPLLCLTAALMGAQSARYVHRQHAS
jgi:hypothetical protein